MGQHRRRRLDDLGRERLQVFRAVKARAQPRRQLRRQLLGCFGEPPEHGRDKPAVAKLRPAREREQGEEEQLELVKEGEPDDDFVDDGQVLHRRERGVERQRHEQRRVVAVVGGCAPEDGVRQVRAAHEPAERLREVLEDHQTPKNEN